MTATMRAAVLRAAAGTPDNLTVTGVPLHEPGAGECRVRVLRSGVCGSDVHFALDGNARTAYLPIVLGHEAVGVVERRGEGVTTPPLGTRVTIHALVTCGECRWCKEGRSSLCPAGACIGCDREGAFAEYVVVPAENLVPVHDAVTDELAALAADSVGTAFHAVRTRGGVGPGTSVAVWGAGGLGLSAIGCARALGADPVLAVDPRSTARQWAVDTGADEALNPDEALARIDTFGGVDVAFEFVGRAATAEAAIRSLGRGGRAVIVGVGHEKPSLGGLMRFVTTEREVVGAYGNEREEIADVLGLLASGRLQLPRAIGDVVPLDAVVDAVGRVQAGETGGSRIVVDVTR